MYMCATSESRNVDSNPIQGTLARNRADYFEWFPSIYMYMGYTYMYSVHYINKK